jgi:hypothetical protein
MSRQPFRLSLYVSAALLALSASPGFAQEVGPEPSPDAASSAENAAFSMNWSSEQNVAFTLPGEAPRRIELELAASGGSVDVSLTRSTIVPDERWRGDGAEIRIGRGLVERRGDHEARDSTYFYVASENEALTWRPGQRRDGDSPLALQEQVEVGDLSAGIAVERGGVQASLAYVEREASARVGNQSYSQDENFAGVTVTMRR